MAPRPEGPAAEDEGAEAEFARVLETFAADLNALHSTYDSLTLQSLVNRSKQLPGRTLAKSTISDALNGKRLPSHDVALRVVQLISAEAPMAERERIRAHWRSRWRVAKHLQKQARRQARDRMQEQEQERGHGRRQGHAHDALESAQVRDQTPGRALAQDADHRRIQESLGRSSGRHEPPTTLPVQRTHLNEREHPRPTPYESELCPGLPFSLPFYFYLDQYAVVWSVFDRCDQNPVELPGRNWYGVVGHGPDEGWIITSVSRDRPLVLGLLLTTDKIPREHIHKYLPGEHLPSANVTAGHVTAGHLPAGQLPPGPAGHLPVEQLPARP
ncbi:hypothetical protein AB0M39_10565 [Streptomyces sp. NPDC051907]|uniref:hypothetical protein n=1 Tax=Streptomyces sp. NPDC051907 TaxID=3155284 RepID=UPI003418449F